MSLEKDKITILLFYLLSILVPLITGVILTNRSPMKSVVKFTGIIGCFVVSVFVVIAFTYDYTGLSMYIFAALLMYLLISGIMLLRNRERTFRRIAVIHLAAFGLLAIVTDIFLSLDYREMHSRDQFNNCLMMVSDLRSVENKYHDEYGEYTDNLKTLSRYAERLCHESGKYCDISEEESLEDICKSIDLMISDNEMFKIVARAKGEYNCYICITPEGINRTHFQSCEYEDYDYCP